MIGYSNSGAQRHWVEPSHEVALCGRRITQTKRGSKKDTDCKRCRRKLGLEPSWTPKPGGRPAEPTLEDVAEVAEKAFPAATVVELGKRQRPRSKPAQPRFSWLPEAL